MLMYIFPYLAILTALPLDDEAAVLAILRGGYEQHVASWKSGKLQFTYDRRIAPDAESYLEMQGTVEWSEGYFACDVERNERLAFSGMREKHNRVRCLESDGLIVGRIEDFDEPKNADSRELIYLLKAHTIRSGLLERLLPEPLLWLNSIHIDHMVPFDLVFAESENGKSLRFQRTLSMDQSGRKVNQRLEYQASGTFSDEIYELDKGGLATEVKANTSSGGLLKMWQACEFRLDMY